MEHTSSGQPLSMADQLANQVEFRQSTAAMAWNSGSVWTCSWSYCCKLSLGFSNGPATKVALLVGRNRDGVIYLRYMG